MENLDPTSANLSPRLTLAVLFFNHEGFVEQAVQGALAQEYSPLEIVFSDDASSDKTFEILERSLEGYDGPHQVVLNRNEKNLGLAGNVNRVMELASGEIIMLAGGDDISMKDRAARSAEVLLAESDSLCVSFGTIRFDGSELPFTEEPAQSTALSRFNRSDYLAKPFFHLNGASRAFRRQAFDFFGPISKDCPTEDSVILLRCVLLGDVLATPEAQVYYRVHENNLSLGHNKHQIDAKAIHRQYLRDLEVAANHGLLTDDELAQLRSILEIRLERRTLERDMHLTSNRLGTFFGSILGSRAFDTREKARMFAAILARK